MTRSKLLLFFFLLMSFLSNAQSPRRFDIIIDEIMADPSPPIGLPNAEFIELKNVSEHPIDLTGWRLSTSFSLSGAFPNCTLPADSFLIITSTSNAAAFSVYGRTIGVPSFPSLANEGTLLSLLSKEGMVIHAVHYTDEWYQNVIKKEGGWTLEMIDTKCQCVEMPNWSASQDPSGGTPGRKNYIDGIIIDNEPPQLIRTYSRDSLTVIALFNETLDSTAAATVSSYSLSNEIGILSATPVAPLFKEVILKISNPLQKAVVYNLTVTGIKDCKGNEAGTQNTKTGYTEEATASDIIINEILFNPRANAYDYVELYNNSDKVLDAGKLFIANRNTSGTLASAKKCSEVPFYIFPHEYVLLTEDLASLQKEYLVPDADRVLLLSSLPSYPDDKGVVVITNMQGIIVDEVAYSNKWHFALLSNTEGISLERVYPSGISQDAGNWHSAASTVGYGTPGYKNSQNKLTEMGSSKVELTPAVFSPDNDGHDDMATIRYQMEEIGYVANIVIFNANGRPVRHFVKNATLSLNGSWNWDGLDEKGQKLPMGIYIVYTEIFNLQGKKQSFKNTITMAF